MMQNVLRSLLFFVVLGCLARVAATPLTFTVFPDSLAHDIPSDFVGLSFEAGHIGDTVQFSLSDSTVYRLLRQIGPGVIRIGGNSVDKDTLPFDSTKYNRFFAFVKKTGWKLMQGLTLGTFDTVKAVRVASLAASSMKSNLYSFEVGNEPDLFSRNGLRPTTWGLSDYENEFEEYETAIRKPLPTAPFSGPTTASSTTTWVVPFASKEAANIMLLTQHYYAEGPAGDSTVTMGRLLSRATRTSLIKSMALVANAAQAAHVPARISECNSVYSGGQKGVSDVFGASLWAADFMFTLAQAGITGVNFHGGGTGNYTPIAISSSGVVSVRPEYYGILFYKFSASGRFVKGRMSDTLANIGIYPLLCGTDSMRVALINKDSLIPYEVTIAGIPYNGTGSLVRLVAPSLHSTTGLKMGGDSIGTGLPWAPSVFEIVPNSAGSYTVSIPAASAGVLTVKKPSLVLYQKESMTQGSPANVRVVGGKILLTAPAGARVRLLLCLLDGKILMQKELGSDGGQMSIPLLVLAKSGQRLCLLSIMINGTAITTLELHGSL
jgi:hypothetical protein